MISLQTLCEVCFPTVRWVRVFIWLHNDNNPSNYTRFTSALFSLFHFCAVVFPGGTGQPVDFFVGDVTSYTLHNLQPGTTYDLKVVAQYTGGMSAPLPGQGTTRTYSNCVKRAGVLRCVLVASSRTHSFPVFMLLIWCFCHLNTKELKGLGLKLVLRQKEEKTLHLTLEATKH